jgi:hypothetical protein
MSTHKLSTAVYAQGWLEGMFESLLADAQKTANEDPTKLVIATQMQEQWGVVSGVFDELIAENNELNRRMANVRSAIQ